MEHGSKAVVVWVLSLVTLTGGGLIGRYIIPVSHTSTVTITKTLTKTVPKVVYKTKTNTVTVTKTNTVDATQCIEWDGRVFLSSPGAGIGPNAVCTISSEIPMSTGGIVVTSPDGATAVYSPN